MARSTSGQNVTFTLTNGLPAPGATLTVWQTTQGAQFVRMAGAKIAPRWTADLVHPCGCYGDRVHDFYRDARAELLLRCYSATLTQRALPAPIHTRMTFRVTPKDHLPRYFSDQGGSFAGVLVQVAPADRVGTEHRATYAARRIELGRCERDGNGHFLRCASWRSAGVGSPCAQT